MTYNITELAKIYFRTDNTIAAHRRYYRHFNQKKLDPLKIVAAKITYCENEIKRLSEEINDLKKDL